MIIAEVETEQHIHGYEFTDGDDLEGVEEYLRTQHSSWQRLSIYRATELRDVTTGTVRVCPPRLIVEKVA